MVKYAPRYSYLLRKVTLNSFLEVEHCNFISKAQGGSKIGRFSKGFGFLLENANRICSIRVSSGKVATKSRVVSNTLGPELVPYFPPVIRQNPRKTLAIITTCASEQTPVQPGFYVSSLAHQPCAKLRLVSRTADINKTLTFETYSRRDLHKCFSVVATSNTLKFSLIILINFK